MSAAGSRLVDAVLYRWLRGVRQYGSIVHYVLRDEVDRKPVPGVTLCGATAPHTERGTRRWRIVHGAGGKVCGTCHAASCSEPSRVDWS